ncbi:hypothetical protein [Spirosoma pulveris]
MNSYYIEVWDPERQNWCAVVELPPKSSRNDPLAGFTRKPLGLAQAKKRMKSLARKCAALQFRINPTGDEGATKIPAS